MADPLTAGGLARLHETAEQHVGDHRVPGLVALAASGDQVHVEALGTLSIGGSLVARDSLFRIASTTKPITAAATLALAGEGLIDIDEPVDRLLPELARPAVLARMDGPLDDTVPAHRAITARDLLTFTFGFGVAVEMFASAEPWPVVAASDELRLATIGPPAPDVQPDPDPWIAGLGSLPLLAQPGERWLYNTGASVCCWRGPRASHLRMCCGPASSSRSACATRPSGPRRPTGSPRPTRPLPPASSYTISQPAPGAARPHSATEPPAWSQPPMTCSPSPGCCSGAVRRSCRPARSGR